MRLEDLRRRVAERREELRALSVVVLAGGGSAEREVSLRSGQAVLGALQSVGYRSELLDIAADDISVQAVLAAPQAEPALAGGANTACLEKPAQSALTELRSAGVIFSVMHGARGENGAWQGLLELLGQPFVSAGVKGSALAMDKIVAKRIAASVGIPTARYWVVRGGDASGLDVPQDVKGLVIKPAGEGSSVGIEMAENDAAGLARIAELARHYDPLLVEERLYGRELTAAVLGQNSAPLPLPLVEIRPARDFYDYTAKYTSGGSEYICPAPVDDALAANVQALSARLFSELELEPYARLDWIVDEAGAAWFLEANTLPGFTELSLVPMAARAAGVGTPELIEILMLLALERSERQQAGRQA